MPRYHVDFMQSGTETIDAVGQEFEGEEAARREAVKALAKIATEEIPRDGPLDLEATVYDEDRQFKFNCSMKFAFKSEAPSKF